MTSVHVELIMYPPQADEAEFDSQGDRVYATFLEGVTSTVDLGLARIQLVCGDGRIRQWWAHDGRQLTVWHRSDYSGRFGPHRGHWHTFTRRLVDADPFE